MSGLIYPTFLFVFVRVGRIPHSTYHADDVAQRGALDPVHASISRVDHMLRGSPIKQNARGIFKRVITAEMRRRESHLSRSIAI